MFCNLYLNLFYLLKKIHCYSFSFWFWFHVSFALKKIIQVLFSSRRKQLSSSKKMSLSSSGSLSFVQLVPKKKKININLWIISSVIKMWKVAPNWLALPRVEVISFWHHGNYKINFYFVCQVLICSISSTTLKVVMLNKRSGGRWKHSINEKLLLKLLHLVLQVNWNELKLHWMWGKSHESSATNLNVRVTLNDIVLVR